MTIPTGTASLGNIQTEFGGVNPISISEYYRNGGSGYVTNTNYTGGTIPVAGNPISINNFRGISKVTSFTFNDVVSTNLTGGYNLRNRAIAAGWNGTSALIATVTINAGIYVVGTLFEPAFSTGNPALPSGSSISLTNNGIIAGAGGVGGNGGAVNGGSLTGGGTGGQGGTAFYSNYAITVNNAAGTIGGGGGGGGGGGASRNVVTTGGGKGGPPAVDTWYAATGGGGGGGRSNGVGGVAGAASGNDVNGVASNGSSGTLTGPGAGGPRFVISGVIGSGNGGAGGAFGQPGSPGTTPDTGYVAGGYTGPGAGGAAGAAIQGGVNITWVGPGFGSRLGSIDAAGTNSTTGAVLASGASLFSAYSTGINSSSAGFSFGSDGTGFAGGTDTQVYQNWWSGAPATGIGNSYWIYATATGSGGSFTGTLGTWLSLSTIRSWNLTNSTSNTIRTRTLTISIATDAAGSNIVATYTNCQLVCENSNFL